MSELYTYVVVTIYNNKLDCVFNNVKPQGQWVVIKFELMTNIIINDIIYNELSNVKSASNADMMSKDIRSFST